MCSYIVTPQVYACLAFHNVYMLISVHVLGRYQKTCHIYLVHCSSYWLTSLGMRSCTRYECGICLWAKHVFSCKMLMFAKKTKCHENSSKKYWFWKQASSFHYSFPNNELNNTTIFCFFFFFFEKTTSVEPR